MTDGRKSYCVIPGHGGYTEAECPLCVAARAGSQNPPAKISDAMIDTKAVPGPFDAFETAKPDEPIFTLQGGDPVASKLVLMWAYAARVRAGVISWSFEDFGSKFCVPLHLVETDIEKEELLLRATSAEQVAWKMQAYFRGQPLESDQDAAFEQAHGEGQQTMIGGGNASALSKLIRHKKLNAVCSKIANSAAEVMDTVEVLEELELSPELQGALACLSRELTAIYNELKPNRK